MKYNGAIYRPPVEADTFLIPVTEGCTHNSCSFCNMYQGVPCPGGHHQPHVQNRHALREDQYAFFKRDQSPAL